MFDLLKSCLWCSSSDV